MLVASRNWLFSQCFISQGNINKIIGISFSYCISAIVVGQHRERVIMISNYVCLNIIK